MPNLTGNSDVAIANRVTQAVQRDSFPAEAEWTRCRAIQFDHDWQGKKPDPETTTEVRLLWTPEMLYVRFLARYRRITVFPDAEPSGRRDQLWDRDVAEIFLQPHGFSGRNYKEFEISPNGFWIDLDIVPEGKRDLQSGLQRRVETNERNKTWKADLALPTKSLTAQFNPQAAWRVNFYRVEGSAEPRFYSAWRPTNSAVPNFHVPEAFGELRFAP